MGLGGEVGEERGCISSPARNPRAQLVVVTGCDRGVGLWVAAAARQWGYQVLAGVLDTTGPGAQYLLGNGVQVQLLDVTNEGHVTQLLDAVMCMEQSGTVLHCLINNAGLLSYAPLEWHQRRHVTQLISVNLTGVAGVTGALLPLLRRNRGRVINIGSPQGVVGTPNMAVYCATKWGVEGFSYALRREVRGWGGHVVVVRPCNIPHKTGILRRNGQLLQEMKEKLHPYTAADHGSQITEMIRQFQISYPPSNAPGNQHNCSENLDEKSEHEHPQEKFKIELSEPVERNPNTDNQGPKISVQEELFEKQGESLGRNEEQSSDQHRIVHQGDLEGTSEDGHQKGKLVQDDKDMDKNGISELVVSTPVSSQTQTLSAAERTQTLSTGESTQTLSTGESTQTLSARKNPQTLSTGESTQTLSAGKNPQTLSAGENSQNSRQRYTTSASDGSLKNLTTEVFQKISATSEDGQSHGDLCRIEKQKLGCETEGELGAEFQGGAEENTTAVKPSTKLNSEVMKMNDGLDNTIFNDKRKALNSCLTEGCGTERTNVTRTIKNVGNDFCPLHNPAALGVEEGESLPSVLSGVTSRQDDINDKTSSDITGSEFESSLMGTPEGHRKSHDNLTLEEESNQGGSVGYKRDVESDLDGSEDGCNNDKKATLTRKHKPQNNQTEHPQIKQDGTKKGEKALSTLKKSNSNYRNDLQPVLEETSGGSNGNVPTSGGTDGSTPTTGGTDRSAPTSRGTNGSVPTSGGTDGSVPALGGTDGSVPAFGRTDGNVPACGGTDGSAPMSGGTDGSVPASGGTDGSAPTSRGTDGSVPASGGTDGSVPASGGTDGSAPTSGGTDGSVPTSGGTDGSVPTSGGSDGSVPTSGGTDGSVPTSGGTDGSVPTSGGTDGNVPTSGGTDGNVPTSGETHGSVTTSGGTDGSVPTSGGTDGSVPTSGGTDGSVPACGGTDGSIPGMGKTEQGEGGGTTSSPDGEFDPTPGDPLLLQCIKDALTSPQPRRCYTAAPAVVRVYLLLLQLLPTPVVDWLLASGLHNTVLNLARP